MSSIMINISSRIPWRHCITVAMLSTVNACSIIAPHQQDYPVAMPEERPEARVVTGGIYQANRDVALFENPVAGRVGDILTIHLIESTTASKKSSTNTKKATNGSLAVSNLFGRAPTINGVNPLNAAMG